MSRIDTQGAREGSLLLHHLLNQSLSGLDFCILWQDLARRHCELAPADIWVKRFLETAELSALDRALATLPEPEEEAPLPQIDLPPTWRDDWAVNGLRIRDTTRVEFRCPSCGWDFAYSLEHPANTEMRLPFDEITCPHCQEEPPLRPSNRAP